MIAPSVVSRREFIRTAAFAGSGLLLAIHLPGCESEGAPHPPRSGEFSPNAWLSIDTSGRITVTVAKSEMGQGVRTSLPMIVADELEADWSKIGIEQAPADPGAYGSQGTGGSSSVRHSWDMLRHAGAAARVMLIGAAAKDWGVDPASCRAENSSVIHPPTGRKSPYGSLAKAAAAMPVPEDPPLKDAKDFHIIGKPIRRLDLAQKVTGTAEFGIDVRVPGMLYAAIARPPVFGAKLLRFDAASAKSVAGVRDAVPIGDAVAVVATSTWAAFRGRDALTVSWDEGEYSAQSSESIWKSFEESAALEGRVDVSEGDAKGALASSAQRLEAVYRAPFVPHATMEPMNCTAHVRDGGCEVWAPTQTPQDAQSEAAEALGVSVDKVLLHVTLLGGGFGRRLENDYVVEAVKTSKALGAPVKVVWTREDDMRHDFYRPASYSVLRAGLDRAGAPVAWMHRIVGPNAGGLVTGGSRPPYVIPNLSIASTLIATGVPTGAWRSVGLSLNCFFVESFIDEMAHAARKDPVDYRRSLLPKGSRLRGALEMAASKAGWGTPLPRGKGRGIACVEGFGSSVAQVAEVSVGKDGNVRVERVVCAIDCGPVVNPDTVEAQMESAIVFGLAAAMKNEITVSKGGVVEGNFDAYELPRIGETPKIEVYTVPESEALGGIGEPGVPPVAPAVTNAIFAATGTRIRRLPVRLSS